MGSTLGEPGKSNPIASGNPSVQATPVSGTGGALGTPQASANPLEVAEAPGGSGVNPALLAAPIGLAGLGTAALGALKAKDAKAVLDGQEDDGETLD